VDDIVNPCLVQQIIVRFEPEARNKLQYWGNPSLGGAINGDGTSLPLVVHISLVYERSGRSAARAVATKSLGHQFSPAVRLKFAV